MWNKRCLDRLVGLAEQGNPQAFWLLNAIVDGYAEAVAEWEAAGTVSADEPEYPQWRKERARAATSLVSLRKGGRLSLRMVEHITAADRCQDAVDIMTSQGRLQEWTSLAQEINR